MRLNSVVLNVMSVQHLVETNKIKDNEALRDFNKAFDTLIDIRDQCPEDDIQGYIDTVWEHIAKLTLN
jgi:hypothetical protein